MKFYARVIKSHVRGQHKGVPRWNRTEPDLSNCCS